MARWTKLLGIALATTVSLPVLAQTRPGNPPPPPPPPKSELTVTGTVAAVRAYSNRGAGWLNGEHVLIQTGQGGFDVYLGPTDSWQKDGFPIVQGDAIEVTGLPARVGDVNGMIAHVVKKGDKAVTLRTPQGAPGGPQGEGLP